MDGTINTEFGELYFESDSSECLLFASPDFIRNVLYDHADVANDELRAACEEAYAEGGDEYVILSRDTDEYGTPDGAYADFVYMIESYFGVNVFES